MSLDLQILDMAGATPEHSTVITNFVNMVYNQLKDRTCRVFPDNVQYKWKMNDGSEKIVIPDASINCQIKSRKGNSFINKRTIEIYDLDYENGEPKYYLIDTVTNENKDDLHLLHFPHIQIDLEQLFDGVE